jgi:hypothetical protein
VSSKAKAPRAPGIALFDLDYTLLGGDATYEWIHFLVRKGAIDPGSIALLDQYYEDYGKGTLDIVAFLHFDFGALTTHARAAMEAWREEYLRDVMAPLILPKARELIASHEARGHVTASSRRQQLSHRADRANDRRRPSARERSGGRRRRVHRQDRRHSVLSRGQDREAGRVARGARRSAVRFPGELLLRRLAERRAADGKVTHPVAVGDDETLGALHASATGR